MDAAAGAIEEVARVAEVLEPVWRQRCVDRGAGVARPTGTAPVVANFSRMSTPPRPLPERPDETPRPGPSGPQTPCPVNDPGFSAPGKPGSEPDYIPPPSPPGIVPEI
jgi:hypothetical protein